MREREFRARMKRCRNILKDATSCNQSVCYILWEEFGMFDSVGDLFGDIFEPKYNRKSYWLGNFTEDNLIVREEFMVSFEEYMIVNQYYRAFI